MHLHEGENRLLQVVKHADPHCMEEVGLREVTHNTGNMSKQVESMVNIARREFCISCLGVGLAERSTLVVIPPGVWLVRRDIISKFIIWTLAPRRDMPHEMM